MKTYLVKEIFLTVQGEGHRAGTPCVFVRFAGCNLWSGVRTQGSFHKAECALWCDTDFNAVKGQSRMSVEDVLSGVVAASQGSECKSVVFTGGEPAIQLDQPLVDAFRREGFYLAIETNGTRHLPDGLDWVCVSPKSGGPVVLSGGDELKFVFPQGGLAPRDFDSLAFNHRFIQPLWPLVGQPDYDSAVGFCLSNPGWRLSVQTHKYSGVR